MKLRQLIPSKDFNELKKMTRMNIAFRLLKIFENHIGQDNGISRSALFRKVFRHTETPSFGDEFRWEYTKRAMHLLRQRTKCFIASKYERGVWRYFVVKDIYDVQCYKDVLDKNIKRMQSAKKKCEKAVAQKWFANPQEWIPHSMKMLEDKK